jgi:signal peptidase II
MIKPSPPKAHRGVAAQVLLGVVFSVLVADQLTKHWAVNRLQPGRSIDLPLGVRLVHARNTGVAFSQGKGIGAIIVPIVVVIGLVGWTAWSEFRQPSGPRRWAPLGYGLILGGALGNIVDRLFRAEGWGKGAVIDMVDVGFWPVFNLADAALCVGVGITLVTLFIPTRATVLSSDSGPPSFKESAS